MKLYIKNMVSLRCKMIVKAELENLGLHHTILDLGEVDIKERIDSKKFKVLKTALHRKGLELMDDKKAMLIEKIKNIIIEVIHYSDEMSKMNISIYLSEKLNHEYTYLSNLFSEVKGITIEHYIIAHKIERVKELLVYNELTLSEIAKQLHYSSAARLSRQFKKVTGLTPTYFKNMKHKRLTPHQNL